MTYRILSLLLLLLLCSCGNEKEANKLSYSASGRVIDDSGSAIEGVKIAYTPTEFVLSNSQGNWVITEFTSPATLTPSLENYTFSPASLQLTDSSNNVLFTGTQDQSENQIAMQIFNWFNQQQLANGLLESVENGNVVSLYDNALAAIVYMMNNDFTKAENIFDFFDSRIETELNAGFGGFSQLRDRNGSPNNHRWMGDNAWLLIALNNYKSLTGKNTYDYLASQITDWLMSLQDADGGLFAGYGANNKLLNYKVTEGNIDAFNAIEGYTDFHSQVLHFLKNQRWDSNDKNLVAWPENPPYLYALDLHPWSYLIFNNYPSSALTTADRFLTTQTAINGEQISGYCFDEDQDTVWLEGTGQMALAFALAGMQNQKQLYLSEIEKALIESTNYPDGAGFPYATNPGTVYGADSLWATADTSIAISSGAWYLFAKNNYNPFQVGREKMIPQADIFWLN